MGDNFRNDQFSFLSGDWCSCHDTAHNIAGECISERLPFLPDIPPALLQGNPMPLARLAQVFDDPLYPNWGLVVYRSPADSVDSVIQAIKRNGTWMILRWDAPLQYRPAQRTVTGDQLARTIVTYLAGEQVYPPQIELIGSTQSQHRVWYTVELPNVDVDSSPYC